MLSRMVHQASKARAGLLAIGVQSVIQEQDLNHTLMTASQYSPSHVGKDDRDVLTPCDADSAVTILLKSESDVDPDLMLRDTRLHEIKAGPLMKCSRNRAQIQAFEAEVREFSTSRKPVPCERSQALWNDVETMYSRHVIELTLSLSPKGTSAFTEGIQLKAKVIILYK